MLGRRDCRVAWGTAGESGFRCSLDCLTGLAICQRDISCQPTVAADLTQAGAVMTGEHVFDSIADLVIGAAGTAAYLTMLLRDSGVSRIACSDSDRLGDGEPRPGLRPARENLPEPVGPDANREGPGAVLPPPTLD